MQGEIPKNRRVLISKSNYDTNSDFFFAVREILGLEAINNNQLSEQEIISFERTHNVKLPNELREYFKIVNGIFNGEWISSLYPLNEITHISKHSSFDNDDYKTEEYKNIFIIGDIMVNSHQWAITLNNDQLNETIIEMDTETKIADSISDFLEKFINESPYSLVK